MTEKKRTENLGTDHQLTEDELNAVIGGTTPPAAPKETTPSKAIEITDFSFGIQSPVTVSR